jgi:hypothetical protein
VFFGRQFHRRDSFITHRAFCDALAQESARVPPIGAGMYGAGGMALGLSGMVTSQLQSFQDQAHSPATTAISGNPAAQFEHLMSTSAAFRGAQPASSSSSPFYLGGAEDGNQSQPGHNSQLHGLMQLPEQHGQPGSNGLLNLGFFSGGSSGQDARLVFPGQFNGAAGGNGRGDGGEHGNIGANTESAAIFSGNLMGNQMAGGGGFSSSLYNSAGTVAPPQMSATALLQKAAQMGATSSGGGAGGSVNSLLRGLGSGGALNGRAAGAAGFMAGESSSRSTSQAENESQFRDLMNSLAASGSGAFPGLDDGKPSTRDFLGVGGGVVRSMGGAPGMPLRHGAAGIGMGSLDPEMK